MAKCRAELHKRHDIDSITKVHDTLKLGDYRPSEMGAQLKEYRKFLESKFDKDRHREKLGVAEFLETPQGRNWKGVGSMVLLLYGLNEVGIRSISDSWLSPVAVDLIQNLLDEGCLVAFELCDESSTLERVLSRLIFQLLEQKPAVVRKATDWYQIESSVSHQGDNKLKGLCAALLKVISLQTNPVFIILNRPELSKEDSPYDYLEMMLNLAKETGTLKVMIVQRAELWEVEGDRRRVSTQGSYSEIFQAMRRDQSRL